jgi:hypothetical protein
VPLAGTGTDFDLNNRDNIEAGEDDVPSDGIQDEEFDATQ